MPFYKGNSSRFAPTILLGFVLCIAVVAPCTALAQPKASDDQKLEADILLGAARTAAQRGDVAVAIERFQEFQKKYPDREEGPRGYADVLFQAGRVREALSLYERLLKKHPNDPSLIHSLVDALLNLGDHPRAKKMLADAVTKYPDRIDFAVSLALLYALDDETAEAEDLIRKSILGHPLPNRRTRLDAASLYIQLRRPKEAKPILDALLKTDPDDARVLALSVRHALLIGNMPLAMRQADKLDLAYPGNIDLRLELASALYAANDYAEAGRLFSDILHKSPDNVTALIGSARVAMRDYRMEAADANLQKVPEASRGRRWLLAVAERNIILGNYRHSHEILDRLLEENPGDRQAAMTAADLYRAENEFLKADALYLSEGATANNSAASRHYALSLFLQHRIGDAERQCRDLLAGDPVDPETNILLARILWKTHRPEETANLLRQISADKNEYFPEQAYFATFISNDLNSEEPPSARPIYTAVTLFDLAMDDGRRDWAKDILTEALNTDPYNVVIKTRLAEWHASFGMPCQAHTAALIYEELLMQEPDNQKWLLGLARANVTMRCYDKALDLYQQLRCDEPGNYLYAREKAETLFFVCGSPKGLADYDRTLCCWSGLNEEAHRLCQERLAKATHFSSPSVAACTYEDLLALEPYEQHIAFELGQAYGMLGNTTDAIDTYQQLLEINPNHRDGQVALEGKLLERRPVVAADTRFVRERGRDGLTSIDRFGEYIKYQFAREDENEHFSVGYGRLSLAPTYGRGTCGDAATLQYQQKANADFGPLWSPCVPMTLFIDGEVQRYDRFVSTRPVFEAGVKLRSYDDLVWTIAGTMDNVLENGESLQQDIYRGGARTGLNYMPCNYWETEATYAFQSYSDDNTRHAAEFRNRFQLTPDPRRFTLLADCFYWNFAEASVFSPGPDPFDNMLHPYWTPMNYVMGGVGVEWKQWLSCDRFDGAQHCWVSFSAVKRWDNQNQNYMVYRGMLNWDITRCLSGYALGEYNEGSPYRGTWAYGGLAWKL